MFRLRFVFTVMQVGMPDFQELQSGDSRKNPHLSIRCGSPLRARLDCEAGVLSVVLAKESLTCLSTCALFKQISASQV